MYSQLLIEYLITPCLIKKKNTGFVTVLLLISALGGKRSLSSYCITNFSMSNSWFRFKQFTVHQENAAMKVCTDACLFGSWLANRIECEQIEKALDIGTGTGLLSLMLAQQCNAIIDAIEIEAAAALQARENFEASEFRSQINSFQGDVRAFKPVYQYGLVFSNPPFFHNDLKSNDAARNIALHSNSLSLEELLESVSALLTDTGLVAVLLPYQRTQIFLNRASEHGLFLKEQVLVRQTEKHAYFRSMLLVGNVATAPVTSEIIIKQEGRYTDSFISLLEDYYLFL
jgi:tRNA1Val (adenine37-N6)-methyltransferase